MSIDISKLSIDELKKLQDDAAKLVEQKREQTVREAREKIYAIAADLGMSLEELLGSRAAKAPKKLRPAVAPKYINTDGRTWSGRGRTPKWLQEALDNGKKLSDFEI